MSKRGRPKSTTQRRPVGVALEVGLLAVVDEEVIRRRALALAGRIHPSRASRTAIMAEALEAKFRLKLRAK